MILNLQREKNVFRLQNFHYMFGKRGSKMFQIFMYLLIYIFPQKYSVITYKSKDKKEISVRLDERTTHISPLMFAKGQIKFHHICSMTFLKEIVFATPIYISI